MAVANQYTRWKTMMFGRTERLVRLYRRLYGNPNDCLPAQDPAWRALENLPIRAQVDIAGHRSRIWPLPPKSRADLRIFDDKCLEIAGAVGREIGLDKRTLNAPAVLYRLAEAVQEFHQKLSVSSI